MIQIGIRETLREEGYVFEYDHGNGKDPIEVWINKEAKMAVRIEWIRMDDKET